MIYLELFFVYFKIGLFGFGGGYAMLSLIQDEIVTKYGWIDMSTFVDIVAISQMTPGPIGINSATYIGYTVTGNVWGSMIATSAICLPSFLIVVIVAYYFSKIHRHKITQDVLHGLRLGTVGLIASAAIVLMNKETFIDIYSWIIFLIAFILVRYLKVSPILMIILAGITGFLIY
ncbi:MAG: chromate transporter [Bacteroidales bacterium]|jgi:chromate transporter